VWRLPRVTRDAVQPVRPGRSHWLCRLLGLALLLCLLYLLREPSLRNLAGFQVLNESSPVPAYIFPFGKDPCYLEVARYYRDGLAEHVLLIGTRSGRLERLGVQVRIEFRARAALIRLGVPETAVTMVAAEAGTDWDLARSLSAWLEQHGDIQLIAVCERLEARRNRAILDRVLSAEAARRVHVRSIAGGEINEGNWWRSRAGVIDLFNAYAGLTHVWLHGENGDNLPLWNPDDYEKNLR
jgi:hypothetical protein